MEIKELTIEGFKSIGSITLSKPNPFSVFVGPNAAGKSNIFEALEFLALSSVMLPSAAIQYFGNSEEVFNKKHLNQGLGNSTHIYFKVKSKERTLSLTIDSELKNINGHLPLGENSEHFNLAKFCRLFVGKTFPVKRPPSSNFLDLDASNLEIVLKRLLKNDFIKEEIVEILDLLIPGFENIEVKTEEHSGTENLLVFEKNSHKGFSKRLISDGTYNIIALIAAIYQSDEPQFLCIEEPENGLNPKVVKELVHLFRRKCEEKGHYIWLNTHSQTLVSELSPEEIILVDKVEGLTQVKQIKGFDLHGLKMDEALLSNALGGGIPW